MTLDELTVVIGANADEFKAVMDGVNDSLIKTQDTAGSLQGTLAGLGGAFTALGASITAPMALAVRHLEQVGSELVDMSIRTGVSVESLSRLNYAAGQSGTSLGGVEVALKKMARSITGASQESGEAARTFQQLGIPIDALKRMDPERQFGAIAEAISKVQDPTLRASLAMQVFGRSGTTLLPLLIEGQTGLDKFAERAEHLHIVMSEDTAKSAEQFGDQLAELKETTGALQNEVAKALLPALKTLVATVAEFSGPAIEFIANHKEMVITTVAMGVAATALGTALLGLAGIVAFLATATGAFIVALLPLIAIFTAVSMLVFLLAAGLGKLTGLWDVEKQISDMMDFVKTIKDTQEKATEAANKAAEAAKTNTNAQAEQADALKGTKESVEKLVAETQDQIDTYGMATREASLYRAQMQVLKLPVAEQEQFNAALQQAAFNIARLNAGDAYGTLRKKIEDATVTLREHVNTFGMAQEEAQVFLLQMEIGQIADPFERWTLNQRLDQLKAFNSELGQLKQALESDKQGTEDFLSDWASADRIWEETRTPMEKYEERLEELHRLHDIKQLDDETFARAVKQAEDQLKEQNAKGAGRVLDTGQFQEIRTSQVDVQALAMDAASDPVVGKLDESIEVQKTQTKVLLEIRDSSGVPR